MQWNYGVQHQFTDANVLTLNYVGSGSRRLNVGGYYNIALTPGPGDPQTRALYPYIGPTFYDRSIGKGSYNASQFQIPAQYTCGNLGRDRFRSDPYWNLDFSIFRAFPIKEKIRAEFRA